MISTGRISEALDAATREFSGSPQYQELLSGQAGRDFVDEFIRNVFRTHYLSSHIVALCFASLPSDAASLLKENLLEEMGRSDKEPPHSALLLELARGAGFSDKDIDDMVADARRQVGVFCATRVPFPTLRELCLSVLIETMAFEFMLSRCSGKIAGALSGRYRLPRKALQWFELHSEVDLRHAEEGLTVIQDYVGFHQFSDQAFERILALTLEGGVFARRYFPPGSAAPVRKRAPSAVSRRIESITIYRLRIPFRQAFSHARKSREESDAVVVRVEDADGRKGYGEALPRPYVTGETTASMIAHIRDRLAAKLFAQPIGSGRDAFDYLQSVVADWTLSDAKRVVAWNAAFCAVELALLDWSLKRIHSSLADFLPPARYEVVYSGVISADSPKAAGALAARFVKFGIRQLKVKVGTANDEARLKAVRAAAGDRAELRADANGVWSADEAVRRLHQLRPFNLQAIEQPVAAADLEGMRRVREETGLAVMADESLVTAAQAKRLIELGACDLFNIRVSKCGGITGSLAVARLAREAGIKIQVGAQVGETGILSAAGRALAAHVPDLAFAEGSFGTWLLSEDVTLDNVAFGYGGAAPLLSARGLSVIVNDDALERLAAEKIELSG